MKKNKIFILKNAYTFFLYKRPDLDPVRRVGVFQDVFWLWHLVNSSRIALKTCFLILGILAAFPIVTCAQEKITGKQKRYFIYLNDVEKKVSIKATVLNKAIPVKADPGATYYWYSMNKILGTQGGYEGKLLDGQYDSFYYNNNLKEQGFYKKGLPNGAWKKWDSTGTLSEITLWHRGYKEGKQTMYGWSKDAI
jgi:hypothetical protein